MWHGRGFWRRLSGGDSTPSCRPKLKYPIPDRALAQIERVGIDADSFRIAFPSDLDSSGNFSEIWLLANQERLLLVSDSDVREFFIRELSNFKTREYAGCGTLWVEKNGKRVELLRYTHAKAPSFSAATELLEKLSRGEAVEVEEAELCERCGRELEDDRCPRCLPKRRVILRLLYYARPHLPLVIIISFLMMLSTALHLAPPYLGKILFDRVLIPGQRAELLPLIVVALFIFSAGGTAVSAINGQLTAWLGSRLSYELRGQVFRHLQLLSLSFYDRLQIGAVVERVAHDTGIVQEFLARGLRIIIVQGLQIVLIAAVLFYMNWRLAFWVLVPVPLVVYISLKLWRALRGAFHRLWERWARLSGFLNNIFSALKEVKAFAQEPREVRRFEGKSRELFEWSYRSERLLATYFPLIHFTAGLGAYLVWYLGGFKVLHGQMSPGTLLAFMAYLAMFYGPLQFLSQIGGWISRSFTSAERVFEILDSKPDVPEPPEPVPLGAIRGEIEFRDVTFGYIKHRPVLHSINLKLRPGEMVGLVGHSGAGKSTMINLLLRFYDVDGGAICVDGVDIRQVSTSELRSQIGVVFQEPFLFTGTICENIAYARPQATREEVILSACSANAHEFILSRPYAYDSKVGERGQLLSVGEKQRIAIARAILHSPRILILDEATSSVDLRTEEEIQEAISRLIKDRTTIAIAHRLSTLRNADRLFVLENGRRVEEGTHEELFRKKGVYYRLVLLQRKVSALKGVDG